MAVTIESKNKVAANSDRVPNPVRVGEVVDLIMERIKAFDEAIGESHVLDIDGVCINNKPCAEVTAESRIKVVNHTLEAAFEVDVRTIINKPLKDLLLALETGVFYRLQGITRIVGYYSRVNNWNASKKQELIQRIESRRDGVGYAVDDNRKPQDADETIEFLNRM